MFQLKQTKHGRGSYLKKNIKKIQPNKHHPKITGLTHSTTHSISLGKLMKTTKLAFLTLQHNQIITPTNKFTQQTSPTK